MAVRYGHKIKMKNPRWQKNFKEAIRIMNFLSLNAPIEKQMYEMNILILKELIML